MKVNDLPIIDMSTSDTGCCPKFQPKDWDEKEFIFKDKLFVLKKTNDFLHVPLNMGSIMKETFEQIENAEAGKDDSVVLSESTSLWHTNNYFSVTKEVPGCEMATLSGTFLTKVFEGPYKDAGKWAKQTEEYVESKGNKSKRILFYYTTCPKCAKHYKKNYVVTFAQI